MEGFRLWFEKQIPKKAIKAPTPTVRQQKKWSCGHQAVRTICKYFGIEGDENEYIRLLGGNPEDGLPPEAIVKYAKKLGFSVRAQSMSVEQLKHFLDRGIPIICSMQAWGEPEHYEKSSFGHYIVAIGHDNTHIYFEDPSLETKQGRGFLSFEEFDRRWHDKDCHGHQFDHLGIAMWMKKKPEKIKNTRKAKHID